MKYTPLFDRFRAKLLNFRAKHWFCNYTTNQILKVFRAF